MGKNFYLLMVEKKKLPWEKPEIKTLELKSTLVGKGKSNNIEGYTIGGNDHPANIGS